MKLDRTKIFTNPSVVIYYMDSSLRIVAEDFYGNKTYPGLMPCAIGE